MRNKIELALIVVCVIVIAIAIRDGCHVYGKL